MEEFKEISPCAVKREKGVRSEMRKVSKDQIPF